MTSIFIGRDRRIWPLNLLIPNLSTNSDMLSYRQSQIIVRLRKFKPISKYTSTTSSATGGVYIEVLGDTKVRSSSSNSCNTSRFRIALGPTCQSEVQIHVVKGGYGGHWVWARLDRRPRELRREARSVLWWHSPQGWALRGCRSGFWRPGSLFPSLSKIQIVACEAEDQQIQIRVTCNPNLKRQAKVRDNKIISSKTLRRK